MIKVFVDGKEGTTGLKIDEKLAKMPNVEVLIIDENKRKDSAERKRLIKESDFTFLCLPDDAAREAAAFDESKDTVIIDASTAHRTNPDWTYGMRELKRGQRERIASSTKIAVPGCHATGFISLVKPLISGKILDENYPFVCHSLTGYSGGGKKMIAEYEGEGRGKEYDAPRQYALSQSHKHQPEMKYYTGISRTPIFNPIVGDFYSGMEVSLPIYCSEMKKYKSAKDLRKYFEDYYCEGLIKVCEEEPKMLSALGMSGRDDMKIYIFGNDERLLLVSLFDNLGKGASGQAVQCFNILTGQEDGYTLNIGEEK